MKQERSCIHLTNSVQTMGESIAEIHQSTSTATAKRDSRAVACSESKAKRQRKASLNDASDAEIQALLAVHQPKTKLKTIVAKAFWNATKKTTFLKHWPPNTCPKTRQAAQYRPSLQSSQTNAGRRRCLTQNVK